MNIELCERRGQSMAWTCQQQRLPSLAFLNGRTPRGGNGDFNPPLDPVLAKVDQENTRLSVRSSAHKGRSGFVKNVAGLGR
ncbi:MAG: hypothetical protein ACJARS_005056 [bacterium]